MWRPYLTYNHGIHHVSHISHGNIFIFISFFVDFLFFFIYLFIYQAIALKIYETIKSFSENEIENMKGNEI